MSPARDTNVPGADTSCQPRLSRGSPKGWRDAHYYLFAVLAIPGLLAFYGLGDDRWQVVAIGIGGSLICLVAVVGVGRLLPQYYAMRLFISAYAIQCLAFAGIAALGLPLSPPLHPFEVNGGEAPLRIVLAMLCVPAGALLVGLCWRTVSRPSRLPLRIVSIGRIEERRRVYLVIAAVTMLFYWPAALENSAAVGYVGRIIAMALMVAPFLAGHDSREDRLLAALWGSVLLVNAVVGISAGSRSVALTAIVLFGAGYLTAMPPGPRRRVAVMCALLATVPLIQLAGVLGVVRDQLGRGGLELLKQEHVEKVFDGIVEQFKGGDPANSERLTMHGVGRFLAWTNMVVPLMTPESIPYRHLDGFVDEVTQALQIAMISGQTTDDLMDVGLLNSQARVYGFMVNSDTAVDFTVVADGWSRGGAPVALLFSFIAALAFTIGEWCTFGLHRYGAGVATILALPVLRCASFDAAIYPLTATVRGMVLNTLIVAVLVVVVESLRHFLPHVGRRRAARNLASVTVNYLHG